MRQWIKDRALGLLILILFIVTVIAQFVFNALEFRHEFPNEGNTIFQVASDSDFWHYFLGRVFENWQSEFLQWGSVIWLTVWLIHRGSAESRDSDDRIERKLDEVLERLDDQ